MTQCCSFFCVHGVRQAISDIAVEGVEPRDGVHCSIAKSEMSWEDVRFHFERRSGHGPKGRENTVRYTLRKYRR